MTAPTAKRADQLVVGDRILPKFLPSAFFDEPGEVVFWRVYHHRGEDYAFVAYCQHENGSYDSTTYLAKGTVEVIPADTGFGYSRADDDPETTQPVGRIAPHFEDGRAVVEVAGGGIEIDPPEGFVPASAPVEEPYEPVTVYFSFGHGQTDPDTGKDLLDHYVTIVGPSYEACVNAMFRSRYGDRWAFDYVAGSAKANEWIPQWTEHERIDLLASAD